MSTRVRRRILDQPQHQSLDSLEKPVAVWPGEETEDLWDVDAGAEDSCGDVRVEWLD